MFSVKINIISCETNIVLTRKRNFRGSIDAMREMGRASDANRSRETVNLLRRALNRPILLNFFELEAYFHGSRCFV